jgi:acetyl-CoA carboxylase carboxyl transferase subunit beta
VTAERRSALDLIDLVFDDGTWRSWDEEATTPPADEEYAATLARARERSGLDEAVITGEGRIRGRRLAVVLCEFSFLAGSIGVVAGERLARAVERATRERLPLLASPASGGTRLQEGAIAFLQMIKVTSAVVDHKAAGLPYMVHLRHPTTGGVLASWGSLGHVTMAEPGALIGFLGPRVFEALLGAPFPAGIQVAEHLYAHGLVDAVVPVDRIADTVHRVLEVVDGEIDGVVDTSAAQTPHDHPAPHHAVRSGGSPSTRDGVAAVPAAESVRASRRRDRPGVRALLDVAAQDVTRLSGTGAGEREPGLLLALARFGTAACMVVGQDRDGQRLQPLGPAGLREAQRGMRVAAELRMSLVTVVDTAGAALSARSEEGGLAAEIAHCLAQMITVEVATVCVLLGEGAGGAALALTPADRVVAAQHAWLSPLPPEGASAVIYRTTDRADEMAERQGIRAVDLRTCGLVDRIVAEEPVGFVTGLGAAIEEELVALRARDPQRRMSERRRRYRALGSP